jgi:hypothetical protein
MRNKPFTSLLIVVSVFTAIGLIASVASAADAAAYASVASLKIEIRGPRGTSAGTCVLIDRAFEGSRLVGRFLTAQRLFDSSVVGAWRSHELRVRVFLDDTTVLDVDGGSVTFPARSDGSPGLALVKASLPRASDSIAPVSFAWPSGIAAYVLKGHRTDRAIVLTGNGGSGSTTPATIEGRIPLDLSNCLGAPAISEAGVFGIATECAPGRPPVIAALSTARTFLTRVLPAWQPSPAALPVFRLEQLSVDPRLIGIACEENTADVEVPVQLSETETVIGATATVTHREGLTLGEMTVMSFNDRVVRLRFSMPANRSTWQTEFCGPDHALVTLGVDIIVMPRQ